MSQDAAGYVTDTPYTYSYHAELDPGRVPLTLLRAGLQAPAIRTACDLGFGQGVSLAVHAAVSDVRWWGNDLLPEHVRHAAALDAVAGSGSVLLHASFEELLARDDVPMFDFIGMHGVLSWVSAENRGRLARFVERHLAPGGVVYTGCNAMPGSAAMVPVRQLLAQTALRAATGSTVERIEAALAFGAAVIDADARYLREAPQAADRFRALRSADRRYLAHEYFNRDWQPLFFAEVAELLGSAGLVFACSAQRTEHLEALTLTPDHRAMLATIADPVLRETTRDFLTNARFRRDYWVRERVVAEPAVRAAAWRAQRVVLTVPRDAVPERASTAIGDVRFDPTLLSTILDRLADHRPHTVAELAASNASDAVDDIVFSLAALDCVGSARSDGDLLAAEARAHRFNAHVLQRARQGELNVLACPVTGAGMPTSRQSLLFLDALTHGVQEDEAIAAAAAASLRLPAESLVEAARRFRMIQWPLLHALCMV
ncbi:MAG: class I SAM-dependent methyltransferase [Burkholderiales bacterium]|nr:class I SAM-dependent methyltransferase [Burkholderiales bacterium]